MEFYDLQLGLGEPTPLASCKTAARFAAIDWSPYTGQDGQYPLGLVAGGLVDGTVLVFDVAGVVNGRTTEPQWTITAHETGAAVGAVNFHPLEPWQVATGASNGAVLVIDLREASPVVQDPTGGVKQSAEITSVAWNSQVSHILATASGDGSVGVWDLKQSKAWCRLQVEHGAVAGVDWNPKEGLYLLTASGDDRNPVIKVWDLGASTSMPLTTMTGHQAGILSTSWCPHDDTLLLSCGKDNRTLLWDLVSLQAVGELPMDENGAASPKNQPTSVNQLFASSTLRDQKHMRVWTAWSPMKRGLCLTCSLDRKVQVHSVLSLATQSGRPPAWLKPASAVTTGFGGTVVSVGSEHRYVTIRTVPEQAELAATAVAFEEELAASTMLDFCKHRRQAARPGSTSSTMWGFMRVIFESNAREQLLAHLGFDAEKIAAAAASYSDDTSANGVAASSPDMSKAAEEMVQKALVVGNFAAAVECCFQTGNLADALLLSYCGGAELWSKTQERYFATESTKRPYLKLLSGIVGSQLEQLVNESDVSRWQETLAILSSYGQSDEFPRLCIVLGDRLAKAGDTKNASLCYMCALDVEHASRYWKSQYEAANKAKGALDLMALHDLVAKVTVFMKAAGSTATLPADIAELFTVYASVLAEQGLFVLAARYAQGTNEEGIILRDRLYRCRDSQQCLPELGSAPQFPFTMETVSTGELQATLQRQSVRQAQAAVQAAQQAASAQYGQQDYQPTNTAAAAQPPDDLAPGWVALQDPSSGQTYYANQTTGESTWERPVAAPAPVASQPVFPTSNTAMDASTRSAQSSVSSNKSTPAKLVSKYGDGFVTSASHPELAQQYGNVGTSNPYTGVVRPGTAQAVLNKSGASDAPPSGPVDINAVELSEKAAPIRDMLGSLHEHLVSIANAADKRPLEEAKKGLEVLVKKLSRGQIDEATEDHLLQIVSAIGNQDFRSATSILTALVNSEWREHKDWLKGLKALLQVSSKKF